MQRNKLKIDLPLVCRPRMLGPSLQTPCTEFVAKELRTPEVDLLFRYVFIFLFWIMHPTRQLSALSKTDYLCFNFIFLHFFSKSIIFVSSPVTASQNSSAENSGEFWRTYSAYTSGYQSVDRLSDIDEFEESFRYLSVMGKEKYIIRNGPPQKCRTIFR